MAELLEFSRITVGGSLRRATAKRARNLALRGLTESLPG
jgi:hypothetical protein